MKKKQTHQQPGRSSNSSYIISSTRTYQSPPAKSDEESRGDWEPTAEKVDTDEKIKESWQQLSAEEDNVKEKCDQGSDEESKSNALPKSKPAEALTKTYSAKGTPAKGNPAKATPEKATAEKTAAGKAASRKVAAGKAAPGNMNAPANKG
ncbi:hypothetical protein BGX34_004271 [Mortierella sp. NVP85]|nr:hypothetical protein BGX34_004271 [Mortierella sp. NVP85]